MKLPRESRTDARTAARSDDPKPAPIGGGGLKTENAGLQMQDQISGGESGKKVGAAVTLKVVDHKMQDQGDRLSDALPDCSEISCNAK